MKKLMKTVACFTLILLAGCTAWHLPFERQLKVQQGNIVTPQMVEKIKLGMSKEQVSYIMGTALLNSTFDANRWDYVYTYQVGDGPLELRRVSISFNSQGKVSHGKKENVTDKAHTIPTQPKKKQATKATSTTQAVPADLSPKPRRGETKSAASAAGKPQLQTAANAGDASKAA